jgi:hypothetical protein
MDPLTRRHLEERIAEEVQTMLTEGDRTYLRGLSRTALLETLGTELQFLGLYSHDDQETPAMIKTLLEKHLNQWCEYYLWQNMLSEQQPTPETKVEVPVSQLIQGTSSAGFGIQIVKPTYYIGFIAPLDRPRIHGSSVSERDVVT